MGGLIEDAGAALDLTLPEFGFAVAVAFAAGALRGFTGFGFALMAVPALALVMAPAAAVPCALLLQTVAGAQLLPKLWRKVDWASLRPLLLGAAAGSPFGVFLLSALPADPMRAAIGVVVLLAVLALWRAPGLKAMPPPGATLAVGWLSGLLNGATAMGGPPVIALYLASPGGVAIGRASLIAFFFFGSLVSIAFAAAAGLFSLPSLVFGAVMFLPMTVGNLLGDRAFDLAGAAHYRRVALYVLLAVGLLAVGRAIV